MAIVKLKKILEKTLCSVPLLHPLDTHTWFCCYSMSPLKTLLSGDELDHSKFTLLRIVLSKDRDRQKLSTVRIGTDGQIAGHYAEISHLLDDKFLRRIEDLFHKSNTAQDRTE